MSGEIRGSLKFWLFFEDDDAYYCENCIDKRIKEANQNLEFKEHYQYEKGESTRFMVDSALEEDDCFCAICQKQIITNYQ